jgi:hypothetical protein
MVSDISEGGARVIGVGEADLPEEFILLCRKTAACAGAAGRCGAPTTALAFSFCGQPLRRAVSGDASAGRQFRLHHQSTGARVGHAERSQRP